MWGGGGRTWHHYGACRTHRSAPIQSACSQTYTKTQQQILSPLSENEGGQRGGASDGSGLHRKVLTLPSCSILGLPPPPGRACAPVCARVSVRARRSGSEGLGRRTAARWLPGRGGLGIHRPGAGARRGAAAAAAAGAGCAAAP